LNIDAQNTEDGRAKVNEILANNKLSLDDLHYEGTLSEDKWDFIEKKDLVKHIIENKK
jgi:hypothetical protein